jgi:hypothetical protein
MQKHGPGTWQVKRGDALAAVANKRHMTASFAMLLLL